MKISEELKLICDKQKQNILLACDGDLQLAIIVSHYIENDLQSEMCMYINNKQFRPEVLNRILAGKE